MDWWSRPGVEAPGCRPPPHCPAHRARPHYLQTVGSLLLESHQYHIDKRNSSSLLISMQVSLSIDRKFGQRILASREASNALCVSVEWEKFWGSAGNYQRNASDLEDCLVESSRPSDPATEGRTSNAGYAVAASRPHMLPTGNEGDWGAALHRVGYRESTQKYLFNTQKKSIRKWMCRITLVYKYLTVWLQIWKHHSRLLQWV